MAGTHTSSSTTKPSWRSHASTGTPTQPSGSSATSQTTQPSELTQSQKCALILQSIGQSATQHLKIQNRRMPTNPRLTEIAKLSTYPNPSSYNWQNVLDQDKKLAQLRPKHTYQIEYFHQHHPTEKVFRVWIPSDPDENPSLGNTTHVRTVHNKHRAQIVRMVQDQFEATRNTFRIMRESGRFGTAMEMGDDALMKEREHHTILGLRLRGVEVCEYWEGYERIEVFFEEPMMKLGMVEIRPGVWI